LELFEEFLGWRPHNIMNLVYLVKFVVTWKKGVERENFEKHASNAPNVHFVTVKSVSHQTLGRPIPSC
jgi:hypothetical protein